MIHSTKEADLFTRSRSSGSCVRKPQWAPIRAEALIVAGTFAGALCGEYMCLAPLLGCVSCEVAVRIVLATSNICDGR